jgi:formylglycine-generating enzyme required for sulfatase activity
MASVKERLAFARTVHQETIEKYDVEWEEAIASIANVEESPAYHGLRMKPQIGLVPIGKDPASGLWEFAHIQTGEIPDRDEEGKILLTGETGLVFVLIPGGTFGMGAQKEDEDKPNYDPQAVSYEGPAHQVTLTPFFLSKYEMTQGQWERFTGKNPSLYTSGGLVPMPPLHPVEQVTWEDCDRVLSRLDLALPTEAQWEYAARGGTTTVWSTGNDRDSLIGAANLADQAAQRAGAAWPEIKDWPELDDKFAVHAPVGSYRANPFGLHDVHGSVWEWCRDWFTGYDQPVRDGDGARLLSGGRARVYRGGSFIGPASGARSAIRSNAAPEFRFSGLGCRPSRVATE